MRSLVQYNRFVCSIKSVVQYNRLFHKIVCKKLSYSQKFVWKILRSVKIKIAFHICLLTNWLRHSMRPIVYNFISLFFVFFMTLKRSNLFIFLNNTIVHEKVLFISKYFVRSQNICPNCTCIQEIRFSLQPTNVQIYVNNWQVR